MVSELRAPHPCHSILKTLLPAQHVTSGAWTCSAKLFGIVNLQGGKIPFKWWHYCAWLQMEILQLSITVKASNTNIYFSFIYANQEQLEFYSLFFLKRFEIWYV